MWQAAYGTDRADTAPVCGDRNNGFGLLFNWNLLGNGWHEVVLRIDGQSRAEAAVMVTTLGEEFARGLEGMCEVAGFPDPGSTAFLGWNQSLQNFVIEAVE